MCPKGIPKAKEPQTPQPDVLEQVAEIMAQVKQEILEAVDEKIEKLREEKITISGDQVAVFPTVEVGEPPMGTGHAPVENRVPEDLRKAVSNILSPKVGIRVQDSPNSPTYTVHLSIPFELSNIENDNRSKIVKYSEGLPKIVDWLNLVKKNIWTTHTNNGESVPKI